MHEACSYPLYQSKLKMIRSCGPDLSPRCFELKQKLIPSRHAYVEDYRLTKEEC